MGGAIMEVKIENVLAVYNEEIARLSRENIMLKAQIKQLEENKQNEEDSKRS
jgi:cell division protein FtsB